MTSTAPTGHSYPDGSLRLYRYGFTGTERDLLQWLVEHGGAHEPLAPSLALIAAETCTTPAAVEEAYRGLVGRGLARPMEPDVPALQLAPVDAVTNLCGCPHAEPAVWPPYAVGNGAVPPPAV